MGWPHRLRSKPPMFPMMRLKRGVERLLSPGQHQKIPLISKGITSGARRCQTVTLKRLPKNHLNQVTRTISTKPQPAVKATFIRWLQLAVKVLQGRLEWAEGKKKTKKKTTEIRGGKNK